MEYQTDFKTLEALTQEERSKLMKLKSEGGRFRSWLRHPTKGYASIIKVDEEFIAWAAIIHHHKNLGWMGVFVHPDYRGKGIAHQALDVLLTNLKEKKDKTLYIHYNKGLENVFRPPIERNRFKDLSLYLEEYRKLYPST